MNTNSEQNEMHDFAEQYLEHRMQFSSWMGGLMEKRHSGEDDGLIMSINQEESL